MRQYESICKLAGMNAYRSFDKQERTLVRFGMFPAAKMTKATAEVEAAILAIDPMQELDGVSISRWFAVGVMDAANAGAEPMIA